MTLREEGARRCGRRRRLCGARRLHARQGPRHMQAARPGARQRHGRVRGLGYRSCAKPALLRPSRQAGSPGRLGRRNALRAQLSRNAEFGRAQAVRCHLLSVALGISGFGRKHSGLMDLTTKGGILCHQAHVHLRAPNAHRTAYLAIDAGPPTRRTCPRDGKPPQSRSIFPWNPADNAGFPPASR